jgi:hypothetical protein
MLIWGGSGLLRPAAQMAPVNRLVNVRADQEWQETGIAVQPGDRVQIRYVSGEWVYWAGEVDPHGPLGPLDGQFYTCTDSLPAAQCVEPIPEFPAGALIGRVGDRLLPVGRRLDWTADVGGPLALRMNDAEVATNSGMLTVEIDVQPAPR